MSKQIKVRKTKRCHPKLDDKILVDQSYKQSADVNNIMRQYVKTGVLPQGRQGGQFIDTSGLPSFIEAHEIVQQAYALFQGLPAIVRKAMDNDPNNLESFINDPRNKKFLQDNGCVLQDEKPVKIESQPSAAVDDSKASKAASDEITQEKE